MKKSELIVGVIGCFVGAVVTLLEYFAFALGEIAGAGGHHQISNTGIAILFAVAALPIPFLAFVIISSVRRGKESASLPVVVPTLILLIVGFVYAYKAAQ